MRLYESILRPEGASRAARPVWIAFSRSPSDAPSPELLTHRSGEIQFEVGMEAGERVEGVIGFVEADEQVSAQVPYARAFDDFGAGSAG